jgi:hypothetical protein
MNVRRRVHVALHASVAANVFIECVFRQGRNEELIESGGISMDFWVTVAISPNRSGMHSIEKANSHCIKVVGSR